MSDEFIMCVLKNVDHRKYEMYYIPGKFGKQILVLKKKPNTEVTENG